MKRRLAKPAFLVATILVTASAIVLIGDSAGVPSRWLAGLSGGVGALVAMFGGRIFERLWPKPRSGWES